MYEQTLFIYYVYVDASDFEMPQPISVQNGTAEIYFFTINDEVTLEHTDSIILKFTPSKDTDMSTGFSMGHYMRKEAVVNIIDNDSKSI